MPSYKLTYFNVRGRAELARYLFAAAGQDYDDNRIQRDTWPALKPNTKFGQLPLLEVDGKPLAQSYAIARFLARELGLSGKGSWEAALCDEVLELTGDLLKEIIKYRFETDETKKQELQKNLSDVVFPRFLGFFEKTLEENGAYLVGNGLTVADLAVLAILDTPLRSMPGLLDNTPKLKAHRGLIAALPKIKEYIGKRPDTDI
ncbi:GST7-like protein [Mya arenaria]|uniref:GST7-like protein n=1 Tax=Mya arenaria TaxID=6604 RepID=A0ABY7G1H1_MYAAR|nr:probable glutathione S-transferase 7 [Mya arenaria]WAR25196.1 GST7-like protein [Mya arenaria]